VFLVVSSNVPATESVLDQNIFRALLEMFDVHVRATMKLFGVALPLSRVTCRLGKTLPSPIASSIFLYMLCASEPVPNMKKRMYPVATSPHLSTVTWPNEGALMMVL
jgi:hypothetical protein